MLRRKPLHGARQHVMDGGFSGRDREPALLDIVPAVFEVLVQRCEPFDKRAGELIQKGALESQFNFRTASFEQGCPQVTLERLHLQRDCRLGEAQPIRCLRDAVGLDYSAETLQLLQSILFISKGPHQSSVAGLFISSILMIATIKYVNDLRSVIKNALEESKPCPGDCRRSSRNCPQLRNTVPSSGRSQKPAIRKSRPPCACLRACLLRPVCWRTPYAIISPSRATELLWS